VTYFVRFDAPEEVGFRPLAGRPEGLQRLLLASGRLPAGDHGPMHLHRGDEILRIVSGEIVVRVGDDRRVCRAGDVVVVPPDTLHGFRATTETVMEVVAEQSIGTFFPVRSPDGTRELVETFRPELPWNRPPPRPGAYTTDEEMERILKAVDVDV
jgi:mannose-6-phosphate isomerase-like protein (cupin superfamily)